MGFYLVIPRSSFVFIFIFFVLPTLTESAHRKPDGPVTYVTKRLSFSGFTPTNPISSESIKLLGSAILAETGSIQIPDKSQQTDLHHLAGRAIYSYPIRIFDPLTKTPASFQTTFSFQFNSTNPSSDSSDEDGGSGLAFILAPDEFTLGRPGPWLGMLNDACDDDYKSVGIEFDTRLNPEFGDPNDNHVGINLGSVVSSITVNASTVGVDLKDGSIHRAWIYYDGLRRYMEIRVGADNGNVPSKPIFSGHIELSPFLKEYMFVGFSASTGNFTQIHNIFSWNFSSTSQASLITPSSETCASKIVLERAKRAHNKMSTSFLIFMAVVVLVLAILLNIYCRCGMRKDKKSEEVPPIHDDKQGLRRPNKPRSFTIMEISTATRSFSEMQKLGSDARGVTYRGTSSNGGQVVVKRFSAQFLTSIGKDRKRMAKEIRAISHIRHPNLVLIRGWCFHNRETIVVYDYVTNGSLDKWLFGVGVLPWTRRFKVLKDVADALNCLHSKQLAHKNVKTSSTFLDVSFRAVLGDFGFVLTSSESKQFESIVSLRADVFDFGILLLEVVAGRRRSGSETGDMDLLDLAWTRHVMDDKLKVVDQRMGAVVNVDQAIQALEIGLLCTLNENKGRPTMEEVVEFLSGERPVPELPRNRPVSLFPYNSTTGLCTGYTCTPFN